MGQQIFNPVDFGFEWTADGWYAFDRKTAQKAALAARNAAAKAAQLAGKTVHKFSLGSQLITRGGIGSGRPEVSVVVTCYGFNAY